MDELIPVINRLQDVFSNIGLNDLAQIDLPQIAVVGSQSSGKSSVLETIVGRDFLPRGSGIVTRRPLVLQLINVKPSEKKNEEEWGEFLHIPNKKIYDFAEIKNEIVRETDRLTGSNKNISEKPINLKIFSPYVLDLTLVDLPGITKVAIGDQPKDIEIQIRNMIMNYINKPNCLILAVTAANTDLANSDALKLAKEVDKAGSRTLGVLTKVDIMDQGTDCTDIIRGEVLPLRLGYIGVVNRSQNDINMNKSIRDALRDEERYFQNHQAYKPIADRMGTAHLAKTLKRILLNHIKEVLPELKNKVSILIQQAQMRLAEYGCPLDETSMSSGGMVLQKLTEFSTEYVETIDGRNAEVSTSELFGGARINYIFTNKFYPVLSEIDACENLTDFDIRTAIRNAKGPRTSLFIPEAAFEILVKRQVKLLETPSLNCVDDVLEELFGIEEHCEKVLSRFPNLKSRTHEFVLGLLRAYGEPLKEFISNIIKIELAYINTNHPDFFSNNKVVGVLGENQPQKQPSQLPPPQQPQGYPPQPQMHPNMMNQQGGGYPPQQPQPQSSAGRRPATNMMNQPVPQQQNEDQQQQQQQPEDGDWEQVETYPPPKNPNQITIKNSMKGTGSNAGAAATNSSHKESHGVTGRIFNFFGMHKDKSSNGNNDNSFFDNMSGSLTLNTNKEVEANVSLPKKSSKTKQPPQPQQSQPQPQQQHQQIVVNQPTPPQNLNSPPNEQPEEYYYGQNNYYYEDYNAQPQQNPNAAFLTNFEERETKETETIKTLLQHYFEIVRTSVSDSVPKAIIHFLVAKSKIHMQSELVRNLYKVELYEELLKENEAMAQKRKRTEKMLSTLLKAQDALNDVKNKKI